MELTKLDESRIPSLCTQKRSCCIYLSPAGDQNVGTRKGVLKSNKITITQNNSNSAASLKSGSRTRTSATGQKRHIREPSAPIRSSTTVTNQSEEEKLYEHRPSCASRVPHAGGVTLRELLCGLPSTLSNPRVSFFAQNNESVHCSSGSSPGMTSE